LTHIQQIDTDFIESSVKRFYHETALVAIIGNVLLLLLKGWVARASGSSAIYADAANSASDVAYSLLMILGLWFALKPPDANHPHGHRRIEPFVSMMIGFAMAGAGIEAARGAYFTWQSGPGQILSGWPLAVPWITGAAKLAMYYAVLHMGRAAHSSVLMASARDNLADVVASAMALIGVVSNRLGFLLGDPLAALLVAIWILRAAWQVGSEGFRQLTGFAPDPQLTDRVIQTVLSVPGVLDADRVIIDHVGPQVRVDIHIKMRGKTPLNEVHRVSHRVRDAVEAIRDVDHAFVHVEPIEPIAERDAP
jgi:cation diffusion facilitator family transporter